MAPFFIIYKPIFVIKFVNMTIKEKLLADVCKSKWLGNWKIGNWKINSL